MNAGGAGGNGLVAAAGLAAAVFTAVPAASAGVAMAWLTPMAPTTLRATAAGTDISRVASRTVWPFSR